MFFSLSEKISRTGGYRGLKKMVRRTKEEKDKIKEIREEFNQETIESDITGQNNITEVILRAKFRMDELLLQDERYCIN